MEHAFRDAFDHKEVKDVRISLREASFYLGTLKTEIRIRLYLRPEDATTVYYEQSHFLKTPMQRQTRPPTDNFADSEEEAFAEAIAALTDTYELALMSGHRADDDWLVPNSYF